MCEKCVVRELVYFSHYRKLSLEKKEIYFIKNMHNEIIGLVKTKIKKLPKGKKFIHMTIERIHDVKDELFSYGGIINECCDVDDNWREIAANKINRRTLNLN